jgi:hypothetical protein
VSAFPSEWASEAAPASLRARASRLSLSGLGSILLALGLTGHSDSWVPNATRAQVSQQRWINAPGQRGCSRGLEGGARGKTK